MAKILPYDSGYMQTVVGRRKRLREASGTLPAGNGWQEIDETFIPRLVIV
jgi:hypothetical protein